jgi:CheY-like chemotaxis protein
MVTKTHRVLLCDDEPGFVGRISKWLEDQGELEVVTAVNGAEAVEALRSNEIDVVVTDLEMPVMDGFALLAHMSRQAPTIPVLVMTAYATPAARERLHGLGLDDVLEKPLRLDRLLDGIRGALARRARGFLEGISLTSILQLLEMERKTVMLRILSVQRHGTMCFNDGKLVDAEALGGSLTGDDAAMEIISWDDAAVEIDDDRRPSAKRVTSSLGFLIMESLRRKDEACGRAADQPLDDALFAEAELRPLEDEGRVPTSPPGPAEVPELQRERLEACLDRLCTVRGVEAVAVLGPGGAVHASRSLDADLSFVAQAEAFEEVARSAHEHAKRLGFEGCTEISLGTKRNLVMVQGLEFEGHVPFRVVAILDWNCDHEAVAGQLGEIVPSFVCTPS